MIENPTLWRLFFLVSSLSLVSAVVAVLWREAIWNPQDTFDRWLQWGARLLGASAFASVLAFCYAVTDRCVVTEKECERYKAIAQAKTQASVIAKHEQGELVTLKTDAGWFVEMESDWNGLRDRSSECGGCAGIAPAKRSPAAGAADGTTAARLGSRSTDGPAVGGLPDLAGLLEQFAGAGSKVSSGRSPTFVY